MLRAFLKIKDIDEDVSPWPYAVCGDDEAFLSKTLKLHGVPDFKVNISKKGNYKNGKRFHDRSCSFRGKLFFSFRLQSTFLTFPGFDQRLCVMMYVLLPSTRFSRLNATRLLGGLKTDHKKILIYFTVRNC